MDFGTLCARGMGCWWNAIDMNLTVAAIWRGARKKKEKYTAPKKIWWFLYFYNVMSIRNITNLLLSLDGVLNIFSSLHFGHDYWPKIPARNFNFNTFTHTVREIRLQQRHEPRWELICYYTNIYVNTVNDINVYVYSIIYVFHWFGKNGNRQKMCKFHLLKTWLRCQFGIRFDLVFIFIFRLFLRLSLFFVFRFFGRSHWAQVSENICES